MRLVGVLVIIVATVSTTHAGNIVFEDITEGSGITFRHTYGYDELSNLLQTTGPGVSLADVDGDGDLDIYFVNGAPTERFEGQLRPKNALFLNNGDATFTEATEAGVDDDGVGMGAVFADIDNDGDDDLYVYNYGPNILYRNDGEGHFTEITAEAGVECAVWSASAAFADVDNDGHLDLFVCNYLDFDPDSQPRRSMLSYKEGYRFFPGPYDFEGVSNTLYHNNGDGSFTDITEQAGMYREGKGMSCMFGDFDLDGDQDLIVANDRCANYFYTNNGDGSFVESGIMANVAFDVDGFDTGAMSVATGDVDGDLYPDLLITNMIFEYNTLYRNGGDGTFADITEQAAFDQNSYEFVGWGAILADFDFDGHLDAFISNGHVQDYIDTFSEAIHYEQPNQILHNQGDGSFRDVTENAGNALELALVSRGCAKGDLDGDGDLDLVVASSNDVPQLMRNVSTEMGHWLHVVLQGRESNRSGVGARIVTGIPSGMMTSEVTRGDSYASQSEGWPRIGLGEATQVATLEIHWPSGQVDSYVQLPVDITLIAVEGEGLHSVDGSEYEWRPQTTP